MSQPPPPYQQPYPPPSPYGAPHKSNKTLWIVLGVIGGLLFLCCGGGIAAVVLGFVAVDDAIEEENRNNRPTEVTVGEAFEHDDFEISSGWRIGGQQPGATFTIANLAITNAADSTRSAYLTFKLYQDDTVVGEIICDSPDLGPDEKGVMDCFSADQVTDYDTVKVADSF